MLNATELYFHETFIGEYIVPGALRPGHHIKHCVSRSGEAKPASFRVDSAVMPRVVHPSCQQHDACIDKIRFIWDNDIVSNEYSTRILYKVTLHMIKYRYNMIRREEHTKYECKI